MKKKRKGKGRNLFQMVANYLDCKSATAGEMSLSRLEMCLSYLLDCSVGGLRFPCRIMARDYLKLPLDIFCGMCYTVRVDVPFVTPRIGGFSSRLTLRYISSHRTQL